jgi:peptide/nickel transport system substrate-binding protein
MKKALCLLLMLLMLMQASAFSEAIDDAQIPPRLLVRVTDGQGEPLSGAQVTVRDASGSAVFEAIIDQTGIAAVDTLPEGIYSAKALDPADGYSATKAFELSGEVVVDLVVRKLEEGSQVTVGSGTEVSGHFFTDMWGNNTSDIDVRAMLHGYSTVAWTNDATYAVDASVVAVRPPTEDADGNRTYTFDVNPGLTYNDGTAITASDYVFSVLLQSAPQTAQLGAMTRAYGQLAGFADFNSGDSDVFSGVRLIDEGAFSLTISAEYLPYFYELTYVSVTPYPISVIAPGCVVADDGEGAYIRPLEDEDAPGAFTADALRQSILDPQTGYLSNPRVTSGPYELVSYDAQSGQVSFRANRAYAGNYEGKRPVIDLVTLTPVKNAQALAQLTAGEIDIINKMSDGGVIDEGLALYGEKEIQLSNYLRSGYGFIGFANEQGPTASENVRKAVAYSLDSAAFSEAFAGDNGRPVYSYYGLGQWMAADYINQMDQMVTVYPEDLDSAKALIVNDGWTLNEKGEAYEEGDGAVRYKRLEGDELEAYTALENPVVQAIEADGAALLPLKLRFAKLRDSRMAELVDQMLLGNLRALGFDVEVADVDFAQMLASINRQADRGYNMFALATNFTHVFDPYYAFNDAPQYQGALNQYGISDADLLALAKQLRETQPGDEAGYAERWLALMQRYSEVLPTVPLYSNVYFDFVSNGVQEYAPSSHWSWPAALLYAYTGEKLELPALTGEGATAP